MRESVEQMCYKKREVRRDRMWRNATNNTKKRPKLSIQRRIVTLQHFNVAKWAMKQQRDGETETLSVL